MREALSEGGDAEAVLSHFITQIGDAESDLLRAVVRRQAGREPQ
jgi:hypothetical protein